jgi:fused signal recognition particle receptor
MPSFFNSKNSAEEANAPSNWATRVRSGLSRTRQNLGKHLSGLFGSGRIDEGLYEELETVLLTADAGVNATAWLLEELRRQVKRNGLTDAAQLKGVLQEALIALLEPLSQPLETSAHKPFIIMLAGVNGAGKTTSIGKLAHHFQLQGKTVLLAAGDTFRAAAIEQLKVWGERTRSPVIAGAQGSDSASLAFNALTAAKEQNIDVLLVDTAGRLQNKAELMNELEKVVRVIKKVDASAPHAVLLVLDATVGQNALSQVEAFQRTAGVTGLVMTKLDGTARGGILVALAEKFKLPVHFIGVGEGIDDLAPFTARDFANAIAGIEGA